MDPFSLKLSVKVLHTVYCILPVNALGEFDYPEKIAFFILMIYLQFTVSLNLRCVGANSRGGLPCEGTVMLVVSFRGVNYGFWYHLGCSGRNANIFNYQGIV